MTAMCKRYPFIATLMECAASTKHGLFVFPRNGRCGERQFVKPNRPCLVEAAHSIRVAMNG
jgi:hypothetical protein